jgi:tetratricopeptide (TPR) repeat protein
VSNASRAWREAVADAERAGRPAPPARAPGAPSQDRPRPGEDDRRPAPPAGARPATTEEQWILVEDVRDEAEEAVARGSAGRRGGAPAEVPDLAEEVRQQLSKAVGTARSERVERRLKEAVEAFEHERFGEAARVLKKLSDEAPTVPAVRELYGLTLYRQEKWKAAAKELEAYRLLTDGVDQLPVLADCYRAMRQWSTVEELWRELGSASPDADTVTEGRIVAAGALADQGDLPGAIRLLAQGWRFPQRPKLHHLRRAYALADLYERVGDVPKARELFGRLQAADPQFADVGRRVRSLG